MRAKFVPTLSFLVLALFTAKFSDTYGATRVSFPYTPIGVASWPWWIAKDAGYFDKHGLAVDMIYVGASPVIVQAMLGGQAGVGAGGGPPLVTNVLQGGDVIQVATMVPYAIQSLIVRLEIKSPVVELAEISVLIETPRLALVPGKE
jgi:ABC-type nitrate/sulfonate/bicarbonate transport system substrate-binding protein